VTDVPIDLQSIPIRLGVVLDVDEEGAVTGVLRPPPALCDRGVTSMSSLVFLVDAVAGVSIDHDPDNWTFTSDLSVRAPLGPPPEEIWCRSVELRIGKRSVTSEAPLTVDGEAWAHCFIAFSKVPRREGDPTKVFLDLDTRTRHLRARPLDEPLRVAAGFEAVDPATGSVAAALRPDLLNPAGTLQGAMVAGLAETAALDLADHHRLLGTDRHVVTELEMRFLAQNRVTPIVSRAWTVGPPAGGLVRIDLVDDGGNGRLTTSV
jgi:acyl-coenzyme A thioesterase PaaI-like protein